MPEVSSSETNSTTPRAPANRGRGLRVLLAPAGWIIVVAVVYWCREALGTVLMGLLAASIIATTARPLMRFIPGPRGTPLIVVALGLLALVGLIGFAVAWPLHGPIARSIENWPQTKQEVNDSLKKWSDKAGLDEPLTVERMLAGVRAFLTSGDTGQALVSRTADVFLGLMLSLAFMLIGSIFLLTEPADAIIKPALRLVPDKFRDAAYDALTDLGPRYRAWVLGTVAGMLIVFTASLIGYSIIGLRMALLLALLAGFAEVVPTIGPAIACAIAALFAATTQSMGMALAVFIVYGIIQAVEAYMVLPMIMRGAVNIHPAVTLFSVVLWGKIFGVPGLMMAIPINLTIWTFLDHLYMRRRDGQLA